MKRVAPVALALVCALGLSGCQSTQEKSDELAKNAEEVFTAKGLEVREQNPDFEVVSTEVLFDPDVGGAAVVEIRNKTSEPKVTVPVSIDVTAKGGKIIFENNEPGLETSLVEAAVVPPGESFFWVHDQVLIFSEDKPKAVEAKIGKPRVETPDELPKLTIEGVKQRNDPVSGDATIGYVKNESEVFQRKVVVYGVARKGKKVVAAGRSQIERIPPGERGFFQIFLIGNSKGAEIELAAPPPVLE